MKVILMEDVDRLGKRGEVQNVKDGYARNFLIPRKLAILATDTNMNNLKQQLKKIQNVEQKESKDATQVKEALDKVSLKIVMKAGEGDVLFGAVTAGHIAEALEKQGFNIDKRKIQLEDPIKRLGDYQIPVKLHKKVISDLKVSVTREE